MSQNFENYIRCEKKSYNMKLENSKCQLKTVVFNWCCMISNSSGWDAQKRILKNFKNLVKFVNF